MPFLVLLSLSLASPPPDYVADQVSIDTGSDSTEVPPLVNGGVAVRYDDQPQALSESGAFSSPGPTEGWSGSIAMMSGEEEHGDGPVSLFGQSIDEPDGYVHPDGESPPCTVDLDVAWMAPPTDVFASLRSPQDWSVPLEIVFHPPVGAPIVAEVAWVDDTTPGYFAWVGFVATDPLSSMVVVSHGDAWTGTVETSDGAWTFAGFESSGVRVWRSVDEGCGSGACGYAGGHGAQEDPPLSDVAGIVWPGELPLLEDPNFAFDNFAVTEFIDVLGIYSSDARDEAFALVAPGLPSSDLAEAAIYTAVVQMNTVAIRSGLDLRFRLVGNPLDYSQTPATHSGGATASDLLAEISPPLVGGGGPTPLQTWVSDYRDVAGADLVISMVSLPGGAGSARGAASGMFIGDQTDASRAFSVASWRHWFAASYYEAVHQAFHNLSLCHEVGDQSICIDRDWEELLPGYSPYYSNGGYNWRIESFFANTTPRGAAWYANSGLVGGRVFGTIMHRQTGLGSRVLAVSSDRAHGGALVTGSRSPPYYYTSGTLKPMPRLKDAADTMALAGQIVSRYRTATGLPPQSSARLINLRGGYDLDPVSQTFEWATPIMPLPLQVRLRLSYVYGSNYFYDQSFGSATWSASVSGISDSEQVVHAELWSEIVPGSWSVVRYRFNHINKIVSCAVEDPSMMGRYGNRFDGCGNVCVYDWINHEVLCDLGNNPPPHNNGEFSIVDPPEPGYDFMMWGRASGQVPDNQGRSTFCCMLAGRYDPPPAGSPDPTPLPERVTVYGTLKGDLIELHDRGYQDYMSFIDRRWGFPIPPLTVTVDAQHGPDEVSGAYVSSGVPRSLMEVYIFGRNGNDLLLGGPFHEYLFPGGGSDEVKAGVGKDVIVGDFDGLVDFLSAGGIGDSSSDPACLEFAAPGCDGDVICLREGTVDHWGFNKQATEDAIMLLVSDGGTVHLSPHPEISGTNSWGGSAGTRFCRPENILLSCDQRLSPQSPSYNICSDLYLEE